GTNSLEDRLSSEGWQSCASCHFKGLTDGVIWQFNAGPRKSVPLHASFNPQNRTQQRLLNYSAIFDEIEDFEANIRNVSGPGNLAAAINGNSLDPNHGLLIGDTGDLNVAPGTVNAFTVASANRPQVTVTLPGSTNKVPALTALREWVRNAVRTRDSPLPEPWAPGAPSPPAVVSGVPPAAQAAWGSAYTSDGKGIGSTVPSLLALYGLPPYLQNRAAESLAAVVADVRHRTDNARSPDLLSNPTGQAKAAT